MTSPRRTRAELDSETLPRGIRNNNPGNLERTAPRTPWQGAVPFEQALMRDKRFEVFSTPVWGIRAIARTLITYQDQHNCLSIKQIINRWAPSSENDTIQYASIVARALGSVHINTQIDVTDYDTASKLIRAIVRHENGDGRPYGRAWAEWYSPEIYDEGLRRAGIVPSKPEPLRKSNVVQGAGAAGAAGTAVGVLTVAEAARSSKDLVEPGSMAAGLLAVIIVGGAAWAIRGKLKRRKTEAG